MQSNPVVEWQRLSNLYHAKSDEEMLELAADSANLTEVAREILRGELRTRGLKEPRAVSMATTDAKPAAKAPWGWRGGAGSSEERPNGPDPGEERPGPYEYTWKTLLCECDTQAEAWQLCEALKQAGIESWLDGPGTYSPYTELDVRSPRVLVAADRLEEARMIAAQPIPQEIVEQSKMAEPEFKTPVCPRCGAGDPVLEGVDPANDWRCEACGKRWTDPGTGTEGGQDAGMG